MLTAGDLVAAGCSARPPGSGPQAAGVLGGGAAPSQGCPPHEAIREVPLTRLTVGMWTSRRHRACQLLLLEQESLLVVLVRRAAAATAPACPELPAAGPAPPRGPALWCLLQVDRRAAVVRSPSRFLEGLTAASPFASAAYSQAGCVHAFEVPFASIRGLDYNNPLCLEARLVLETSGLRKREFPTVSGGDTTGAHAHTHRRGLEGPWLLALAAPLHPRCQPPLLVLHLSDAVRAVRYACCADGGCPGVLPAACRPRPALPRRHRPGQHCGRRQAASRPAACGAAVSGARCQRRGDRRHRRWRAVPLSAGGR